MAKPQKDRNKKRPSRKNRADDEAGLAIRYVRGGSICDPGEKGARLIRGTGAPAVCRTTPGPDPRPRWRVAGR